MGIFKDFFKDFLFFVEGKVWFILIRFVWISLVIFLMKLRGGELNRVFLIFFNVFKFSI